jgi:hypothetical protein
LVVPVVSLIDCYEGSIAYDSVVVKHDFLKIGFQEVFSPFPTLIYFLTNEKRNLNREKIEKTTIEGKEIRAKIE